MKAPTIQVYAFLLILLSVPGCAAKDPIPPQNGSSMANESHISDAGFVRKLEQLNSKNPVTDAQKTIAAGQRYFLCNIGRSRTVPGLDQEVYGNARQYCQTQCLDGVTDAILGDNHLRYLQAAMAYSASWNKVMINVCK